MAVSLLGLLASGLAPQSPSSRIRDRRAPAPLACTPIKSDDKYDYYRRSREVSVSLAKPLGTALEEVSGGGVKVVELVEGGSAMETGLVKVGDRLRSVCGTDVSGSDIDSVRARCRREEEEERSGVRQLSGPSALSQVMGLLGDAPAEVELQLLRNVIVREEKVIPFLEIEGGNSGPAERGAVLRSAVLASQSELYRGMAKVTNCGGAGQCLSCQVEVLEGMENLSPFTDAEKRMLKKKPDNYRLACQAIVNGDVKLRVP